MLWRVLALVILQSLGHSPSVQGRELWLARDGRALHLYRRRFGQEHPEILDELSSACSGEVCGALAGQAVSTLLADSPECAQQDLADQIIDAAAQFDATTQTNMIAIAVKFRQAEKNTPPDFTTNPPTNRNSVFCQTAPKNAQLNGLVQAQDPANNPNVFFDPATKSSVQEGSQANTFPFGTASDTLSDTAPATNTTVGALASVSLPATSSDATGTAQASSSRRAASSAGDFGKCSIPQIEFAVGFDQRKETSFQPTDKTSYNHGSADNIDIITQFMCDNLVNFCGADQTAQSTCAQAKAAADTKPPKTGGQADAFNAVFGIQTNFAAVAEVDDQGRVVAGTGSSSAPGNAGADAGAVPATTELAATSSVAVSAAVTATAPAVASSTAASDSGSSSSGIGNFGSCSVPKIEFGQGFDGRTETSFQPADKSSYNHGSAQAIDIITKFMCDTLTNTCGADQTAKNTCAQAAAAADAQPAKTGGQADAFNAVFDIQTDFAAITPIDDQGRPVSGIAAAGAVGSDSGSAPSTADPATASAVTTETAAVGAATETAAAAATTATAALTSSAPASAADSEASCDVQSTVAAAGATATATASSDGNGNFGKCSVPKIEFAAGFDGRTETSFQPADKASYNHGSAQNIDIITQFMCDNLVNSCSADQTAQSTCAQAKAAADTKPAKTGSQADAFNAVFGIQTDFASVQAIDDQGQPIPGSTSKRRSFVIRGSAQARAACAGTTTTTAVSGSNLQAFTGTLGAKAPAVTALGNGKFGITGGSVPFNDAQAAISRSCDQQNNACANAANASGNQGSLTVAACNQQLSACNAQNGL